MPIEFIGAFLKLSRRLKNFRHLNKLLILRQGNKVNDHYAAISIRCLETL